MLSRENLIEMYQRIGSLKGIAKEIGVYDTTVGNWFKKYKIEYNKDNKNKSRTDHFNENYFSEIDTEEKAYWLGFIAADGNVSKNRLRINLARKDSEHLYKFRNALQSVSKIKEYTVDLNKINKKWTKHCKMCYFVVTSSKMINDLKKYNIIPNKTKYFELPSLLINNKYIDSFYRGYFDGDGCIKYNHKKICIDLRGNKYFLEETHKIICDVVFNETIKHNIYFDKTYRISYYGDYAEKIIKWLYFNAHESCYLNRKMKIIENYGKII